MAHQVEHGKDHGAALGGARSAAGFVTAKSEKRLSADPLLERRLNEFDTGLPAPCSAPGGIRSDDPR